MNEIKLSQDDFLRRIAAHKMTILQDCGVYRHIIFSRPDDGVYHFGLTTFPGHLVITGDCGCYVFRRSHDMFELFRCNRLSINPWYWAEKMEAHSDDIRIYSAPKIKETLTNNFEVWLEDCDEEEKENAREEFREKILSHCDDEADFNSLGYIELECGYLIDPREFDAYDFDNGFLFCLYAIVWGIQQYDQREATRKGVEK